MVNTYTESEIRDVMRGMQVEIDQLRTALDLIAGFTLSQFMGPHDMALECVTVARKALDEESQCGQLRKIMASMEDQ